MAALQAELQQARAVIKKHAAHVAALQDEMEGAQSATEGHAVQVAALKGGLAKALASHEEAMKSSPVAEVCWIPSIQYRFEELPIHVLTCYSSHITAPEQRVHNYIPLSSSYELQA